MHEKHDIHCKERLLSKGLYDSTEQYKELKRSWRFSSQNDEATVFYTYSFQDYMYWHWIRKYTKNILYWLISYEPVGVKRHVSLTDLILRMSSAEVDIWLHDGPASLQEFIIFKETNEVASVI
jgi:hypothetical protein